MSDKYVHAQKDYGQNMAPSFKGWGKLSFGTIDCALRKKENQGWILFATFV